MVTWLCAEAASFVTGVSLASVPQICYTVYTVLWSANPDLILRS
jgi:hypothetical protein